MRYRWDPAYPMGRRDIQSTDANLRASDDERNAVADKLSRHYAEGRLDEADSRPGSTPPCRPPPAATSTASSTTCRPLPSEPPPPPPRHRRVLPWVLLVAFLAIAAGATLPFYPMFHVPWLLFAVIGFVLWRRAAAITH